MFHAHDWKEIARTYAAPPGRHTKVTGGQSDSLLERIVFGVTTILWECQDRKCAALRKQEMLGSEQKATADGK